MLFTSKKIFILPKSHQILVIAIKSTTIYDETTKFTFRWSKLLKTTLLNQVRSIVSPLRYNSVFVWHDTKIFQELVLFQPYTFCKLRTTKTTLNFSNLFNINTTLLSLFSPFDRTNIHPCYLPKNKKYPSMPFPFVFSFLRLVLLQSLKASIVSIGTETVKWQSNSKS